MICHVLYRLHIHVDPDGQILIINEKNFFNRQLLKNKETTLKKINNMTPNGTYTSHDREMKKKRHKQAEFVRTYQQVFKRNQPKKACS